MKKFVGAVLLACACVGLAFAQAQTPPAKGASVADGVKQLEHDWVDAAKASDTDKLGQILADDWAGIGYDGSKQTKKTYVPDWKSGKSKLESFEFGPMDVKVMGSVAVVQGSDTENRATNGKASSRKFVRMHDFANRDGKRSAVLAESPT